MLGGFVNAAPGFTDVPLVVNGASDLIEEVFGDGAGIAWQAHIGGFFAGLIAMRLLMPGPLLRRG